MRRRMNGDNAEWIISSNTIEGIPFWIVLRHVGVQELGHKWNIISMFHPTEELARAEAERLARIQEARFYIMKTMAFVEAQPSPLVWSDRGIVPDDVPSDIPPPPREE